MTLNDAAHISQDIDFEEKMARYHLDYRNSSDAVKARMHQEINRELDLLAKQKQYHGNIQDPPKMTAQRRTFGVGGPRRLTGAEIAEKELERNDKEALNQIQPQPLRSAPTTLQQPFALSAPFVMTFNRFGQVVQSSQPAVRPTTQINVKGPKVNVVALDSSLPTETHIDVASKSMEIRSKVTQMVPSVSDVEISSHTSSSRSNRQVKRKLIYQGDLVQPLKRIKRSN